MEYQFNLTGGSSPVIKRYQVGVTNNTPGIPYTVPTSNLPGVVIGTTTTANKAVGVSVEAPGTYNTAQQTGAADPAATVALILSPYAVYSMPMNGGAANGTAMVLHTAVSGGSDGLTIVSDVNTDSPELALGTCFCLSGANVGVSRKITSNSTTTMTFTVAWPRDVAAGDTFVVAPYNPLQGLTLQLTTTLDQADASIAVGTGAAFKTIELKFNDGAHEGRSNSYVYAMLANHVLSAVLADS